MTLNDRYPQFQGYAILWRWISRVCTVVQYAVQYSVLEAMTRVYGKTENSTPRKYKMDKDIQTPLRIYDYVAELSCCAQFEQNRLTQFCWGNRGSLSFNSHTHRQAGSQTNSFISPTDHKYWRIWHIYGSKRVVSRPDVPLWGIVDDKSSLGVQIPKKNIFWGQCNAKPIIERDLRKSHVNGSTMLKLYSML